MSEHLKYIQSPADLKKLNSAQAKELASEIRHFLVQSVSKTGGHLGPNLGVVELTIALHRQFTSPRDLIVFEPAPKGWPVWVPFQGRIGARRCREFACLYRPVLGGRDIEGAQDGPQGRLGCCSHR